ncbi:MAG: YHS domain-containing protein [Patescibacteria group bacterium]
MAILDFFKDGEKDPVCGMKIDLATTQYKSTRDGKEYGFCSSACKETFDKGEVKTTKEECCY